MFTLKRNIPIDRLVKYCTVHILVSHAYHTITTKQRNKCTYTTTTPNDTINPLISLIYSSFLFVLSSVLHSFISLQFFHFFFRLFIRSVDRKGDFRVYFAFSFTQLSNCLTVINQQQASFHKLPNYFDYFIIKFIFYHHSMLIIYDAISKFAFQILFDFSIFMNFSIKKDFFFTLLFFEFFP